MKKILRILPFLLLIITLTSCSNADEYQSMAVPGLISAQEIKDSGYTGWEGYYDNTLIFDKKDQKKVVYSFSYPVLNKMNAGGYEPIGLSYEPILKGYDQLYPGHTEMSKMFSGYTFWPDTFYKDTGIRFKNLGDSAADAVIYPASDYTTPKKKVVQENIYGTKKDMLAYSSADKKTELFFYPTLTGIACEIKMNEKPDQNHLTFTIDSTSLVTAKSHELYTAFGISEDEDLRLIVQSLGTKLKDQQFIHSKLLIQQVDAHRFTVMVSLQDIPDNAKYPMTTSLSFEKYTEKAIIDSQCTSAFPDLNSYLKSYMTLGTEEYWGTQRTYVRFATENLPKIDRQKIVSAQLRIKKLYGNKKAVITATNLEKKWCSWTLNWTDVPEELEPEGVGQEDKYGYYHIDITDLVRSNLNINNEKLNNVGIKLQLEQEDSMGVGIPTADNSIYPYALVIEYEE